ncbi:MAG: hypothetical protein NT068_00210 [Candidatus Nomurabacteria bacterium]|nr:hypothetical protein [Candidatus Nomurabacteria bacterium]
MNKERLSLEEVKNLLLKNDVRTIVSYIGKGWIPEIAYNEKEMSIDAVILAETMGVKDFTEPFIDETEARGILCLPATANIFDFCKKKRINVYRLADIKGVAYLFRKSDLDKYTGLGLELHPFAVEEIQRRNIMSVISEMFPMISRIFETERGVQILERYLEGETLEEIGRIHDLTRERVRQILGKTILRTRHRTPIISKWFKVFSKTEYATLDPEKVLKLLERGKELEKENQTLRISLEAVSRLSNSEVNAELSKIEEILKKQSILQKPVVDLDLSVRALNTLRACGMETLADVVNFSELELLQFRNFGKKSLDEVKEMLAFHGLTLKQ